MSPKIMEQEQMSNIVFGLVCLPVTILLLTMIASSLRYILDGLVAMIFLALLFVIMHTLQILSSRRISSDGTSKNPSFTPEVCNANNSRGPFLGSREKVAPSQESFANAAPPESSSAEANVDFISFESSRLRDNDRPKLVKRRRFAPKATGEGHHTPNQRTMASEDYQNNQDDQKDQIRGNIKDSNDNNALPPPITGHANVEPLNFEMPHETQMNNETSRDAPKTLQQLGQHRTKVSIVSTSSQRTKQQQEAQRMRRAIDAEAKRWYSRPSLARAAPSTVGPRAEQASCGQAKSEHSFPRFEPFESLEKVQSAEAGHSSRSTSADMIGEPQAKGIKGDLDVLSAASSIECEVTVPDLQPFTTQDDTQNSMTHSCPEPISQFVQGFTPVSTLETIPQVTPPTSTDDIPEPTPRSILAAKLETKSEEKSRQPDDKGPEVPIGPIKSHLPIATMATPTAPMLSEALRKGLVRGRGISLAAHRSLIEPRKGGVAKRGLSNPNQPCVRKSRVHEPAVQGIARQVQDIQRLELLQVKANEGQAFACELWHSSATDTRGVVCTDTAVLQDDPMDVCDGMDVEDNEMSDAPPEQHVQGSDPANMGLVVPNSHYMDMPDAPVIVAARSRKVAMADAPIVVVQEGPQVDMTDAPALVVPPKTREVHMPDASVTSEYVGQPPAATRPSTQSQRPAQKPAQKPTQQPAPQSVKKPVQQPVQQQPSQQPVQQPTQQQPSGSNGTTGGRRKPTAARPKSPSTQQKNALDNAFDGVPSPPASDDEGDAEGDDEDGLGGIE